MGSEMCIRDRYASSRARAPLSGGGHITTADEMQSSASPAELLEGKVRPQGPNKFMVVVYDHTVQEHHLLPSGTLMASTCDLKGTKIGETAQCVQAELPVGCLKPTHRPTNR